jgi:hypothetical protein
VTCVVSVEDERPPDAAGVTGAKTSVTQASVSASTQNRSFMCLPSLRLGPEPRGLLNAC